MVHLWAFLEPRSSSGSELIFVLSEGVGVRRKIVFNGCEFERDAQECQTLFHPLSLSPLFSCVDEYGYVVFFPPASNLGDKRRVNITKHTWLPTSDLSCAYHYISFHVVWNVAHSTAAAAIFLDELYTLWLAGENVPSCSLVTSQSDLNAA